MPDARFPAKEFVTLARLLRPQGRKGELLSDLLTDLPEQLAAGARVFLVSASASAPDSGAERIAIESQWMPTGKNAGRIVIKLPGCDSINDAEKLAGFQLMVPASERPALEEDTFYISDLIGCTLHDEATPVGEVVDIEFAMSPGDRARLTDAAPLLAVRLSGTPDDAEPALIPFVRAQLELVDITARRIVMRVPRGLLETES